MIFTLTDRMYNVLDAYETDDYLIGQYVGSILETLDINVLTKSIHADLWIRGNYIMCQDKSGRKYWFTIYDDEDGLNDDVKSFYCYSGTIDIVSEEYPPISATQAQPFEWYFNRIFSDTGITLGINEISGLSRKLEFTSENATNAEMLQFVLNGFDNAEAQLDVKFDGSTPTKLVLNVYKRIGEEQPQAILSDEDDSLTDLTRKGSLSELGTCLDLQGAEVDEKTITLAGKYYEEKDAAGNILYYSPKNLTRIFSVKAHEDYYVKLPNKAHGEFDGYINRRYKSEAKTQDALWAEGLARLKKIDHAIVDYDAKGDINCGIGDNVQVVSHTMRPPVMVSARTTEYKFNDDDRSRNEYKFSNYVDLESDMDDLTSIINKIKDQIVYVIDQSVMYCLADQGVTAPTTEWTNVNPGAVKGKWLWVQTTINYSNGTSSVSEVATYSAINGEKGDPGKDGEQGPQGESGPPGEDGQDGLPGKDGLGIVATQIMYAGSDSGTIAPSTGWTATIPTLSAGKYLWTQTTWLYSDNTGESGYSVSRIGKDGNTGKDGVAGKDGVGLVSTAITYAKSTSGTMTPTTGWTTAIPSVPAGQFLWTKSLWAYTDGTTETGYSVAKMGDTGPAGKDGTDGVAGKDGVGLKSTAIQYAQSTSGTTAPTSGWATSVPTLVKEQYLWTKTVWTYTDNSNETGYTVSYNAKDGNNGTDGIAGKDGVGISNTVIEYVGAVSGTSKPTSGWSTTIPTVPQGQYLWTRTTWTYTDGTKEQGYSTALMGPKGDKGDPGKDGSKGEPGTPGEDGRTPYVHTAYKMADGMFTDTYPGENLLVVSQLENGAYDQTTGLPITSNELKRSTVPIKLEQGASYIISNPNAGRKAIRGFFYDAEGNFLTSVNTNNAPAQAVIPENADTMHYIVWLPSDNRDSHKTWKFEKGTSTTIYTPSPKDDFQNAYPVWKGSYTDYVEDDSQNPDDYVWERILGESGEDGIAGKDGIGLSSTDVTYAQSASGITAPMTGWTATVPTLVKGQHLWTKTVWNYTDDSSETGYTVSYNAKDGNDGTDGIAGKDGVGIASTVIQYVGSTSGTTKPTTGWSTTIPTVSEGSFLWTRTIWTYSDGTDEMGYSVAKMGAKGSTGSKGDQGEKGDKGADGLPGKDGVGIKSTDIQYAQSTSGTTAPTSGWTTSVPTLVRGQYLWTKTVWTYTDNSSETGYTVSYNAKDGNTGKDGIAGKDGVGISNTAVTYAKATSGTTAPSTGWTATVPSVPAGQYLWTRTIWTYTDNTTETGYSVALMGKTGATGKDGVAGKDGVGLVSTQVMYAGSDSGTVKPATGWTATVPTLAAGKYLWTETTWVYSDNTGEAGYSVSRIGKDGNTGKDGIAGKDGVGIGNTVIEYVGAVSGTSKPTSGWSTTIPTVPQGQYLWTRTTWTYTDGTKEQGYSAALMGPKGDKGDTGATGPKGADGKDGAQGIPGEKGEDGNTSYLHTAWKMADGTFTVSYPQENMIVLSQLENGAYDQTTGVPTSGPDLKRNTVPVVLESGANYVVSNSKPTKSMRFFFYDADGGYISTYNTSSSVHKITIPSNATKMNYILWTGSQTGGSYVYWKLEKGATPTIYTPAPSEDYTNAYPKWRGEYSDFTAADSTNPDDYTWTVYLGEKGDDGIAGKDGIGLKSTVVAYQASASGTTPPTGTWVATPPTVAKGQYLWTKTTWTYTDNTNEIGYSVAYMGTNGNNGTNGVAGKDGVGIKATTITYAKSTSGTTAPTTGWTSTIPTVAAGQYLWTKTVWAYTDNTNETGYSVAKMGDTGATGPKGDTGDTGPKGDQGIRGVAYLQPTQPSTTQEGAQWFKTVSTTDKKVTAIYTYTGGAWVQTPLTATALNVTSLSSLTANLGTVTAGTINGVTITGSTINGAFINGGRYMSEYTIAEDPSGMPVTGLMVLDGGAYRNTYQYDTGSTNYAGGLFYIDQGGTIYHRTNVSGSHSDSYTLTPAALAMESGYYEGALTAQQLTNVPWTNLPYESGFTTAENNPCQYRVVHLLDGSRELQMRGQVQNTGGTALPTATSPYIGLLPATARPIRNELVAAADSSRKGARVAVLKNGYIQIDTPNANTTYVSLGGIRILLE
ncbi:hypothetical protein P7G51_06260 [Enterococcus asini]|uniref:hypothetical protein n=1 Tax=Enterococcus asini TaxID=57732 RepID=UPI002890F3E5|nr:hypothetical protein [Enterococcus asini]MDT2756980.1 hypothetical protein [Enterococcus asini]